MPRNPYQNPSGISRPKKRPPATRGERVFSSIYPNHAGSSQTWTQNRLQQVQHYRHWVYVASRTIGKLIAQTIPNFAYVEHRKHGQKFKSRVVPGQLSLNGESFPLQYRRKSLGNVIKPHEDLEPLEWNHPLVQLWENPNPYDTANDLVVELEMFEDLCGVSYLWAVPNAWGVPCELWVIPSHWVWPRTKWGGYAQDEHLISYYEIHPWGTTSGGVGVLYIPTEEVIRFGSKSPLSKIDSWSPLTAMQMWVDTEESMSKSRWAQLANQAMPSLAVELGEGYEDPDDDAIARVSAKFFAKYQGEFKTGMPFIGPPGAKLTPLSFNPEQMMYHTTSDQVRDNILAVYTLNKVAVGIVEGMTYGGNLAALQQTAMYCINPRLAAKGQRITKDLCKLFAEDGRQIRCWWDDLAPIDPQQLNQDLAEDRAHNAITPNEVRNIRGREPYERSGNNPIVQTPAGPMPLCVNVLEDLSVWGEQIAEFNEAAQGGLPNGAPGEQVALSEQADEDLPPETEDVPLDFSPGVDEPNGKPQKSNRIKSFLPPPSGNAPDHLAFLYGQLLVPDERRNVWPRNPVATVAILAGWRKDGDQIFPDPDGGSVIGMVVALTGEEVAANDNAELPYRRVEVTLADGRLAWAWIEPRMAWTDNEIIEDEAKLALTNGRAKAASAGTCTPGHTQARDGCTPATDRDGKPTAKPSQASKKRVVEPEPKSEKAARAKAAHKLVGADIQRYAETYNEPRFAKAVGGVSHPDNEPMDITAKNGDLIELKTLVDNSNAKITMDTYSQIRKIVKEKEAGKQFHTVISDDTECYKTNGEDCARTYYYRRGVAGSARIGSMHKCKDETELKKLMSMPEDKLPDAAKRTDGKLRIGKWEAFKDEQGKGFANKKTGQVVRAKK